MMRKCWCEACFMPSDSFVGRSADDRNIPNDSKYEDWLVNDFHNEYCKDFKKGSLEGYVWAQ